MIARRALLSLAWAGCLAACSREVRCATCGMRVDPKSPFRADLMTAGGPVHFDTLRCALLAWRGGRTAATRIEVADFYDLRWQDGAALRFVTGSDVIGPMGADLIPVDAARVDRFVSDHHGARVLTLSDITLDVLTGL